MKFSLGGTRRKAALVVLATGALIVSGAVVAVARDGGDQGLRATSARPQVAVNSSGGLCKAGFDTRRGDFVPESDVATDNPPANRVTLTKGCAGVAAATFSAETNTSDAGDFIHLDMRATCVGSGGFSSHHCTVGTSRLGQPGLTLFQTVEEGTQVHSMTMVFTGLSRGKWRFDALVGGNNHAFVDFRTFAVQAYNGG
jgi:hypothetical protein